MHLHHEAEQSFQGSSRVTRSSAEPVLELLSSGFTITWFREHDKRIWLAIVKPTDSFSEQYGLTGEYLVIGNGHDNDFYQRTLKLTPPDDLLDRLDGSIVFVANEAAIAPAFCAAWAKKNKISVVLIRGFDKAAEGQQAELHRIISGSLWRRDFFADSEPVKDPAEFFGRDLFVNEVYSRILLGSPLAIFGLRKVGKTSLLQRIYDLLESSEESVNAVAFVVGNATRIKSGRWWGLALEILMAWRAKLERFAEKLDIQASVKAERLKDLVARGSVDSGQLASAFEKDVQALLKAATSIAARGGRDDGRLIIIIDECDHLYPHGKGSGAWREDFFHFWDEVQAIKRRLEDPSGLVFLLSGVNPSGVERGVLEGRANPLYELESLYLPPMDRAGASSLLRGLGGRMGLDFEDAAVDDAFERVGGHPLILRRLGSAIHELNKGRADKKAVKSRDVGLAYSKRKKDFFNQVLWILEHLAEVAPDEEALLREVATGGIKAYADYLADNDFRETYAHHLEKYGLLIFESDLPVIALPIIREALRAPVASEFLEQKRQLKQLVEEVEAAIRARLSADLQKAFDLDSVAQVVNAIPSDAKNRALDRSSLLDLGGEAGLGAVLENLNWGDYDILMSKFYESIGWVGDALDKEPRLDEIRAIFNDSHLVRHNNDIALKALIDKQSFQGLIKRFWRVRDMLSA